MKTFEELGLGKELLQAIKRLGYSEPTNIQEASIPPIMEGQDVIGESATGSGKTLAFGCGVVETVIPGKGLQALILTPTRELAEQVKESLRQIAHSKRMSITTVYGGVSISNQIKDLKYADVAVATPGRLLDHLQRNTVNLSRIRILVLDEADRMVDMGFIEDVEKIIRACPKNRQTLCFSATISTEIKKLSDKCMRNPVNASVKKHVDPEKLKQFYYDTPKNMKLSLLMHLLKNEHSDLVMVFCNTRRITDFVVKNLRTNDINAIAIHGGLSQNKRTKTIESFNKGKAAVLVCTDVAARGLHIDNVSHIYNYDIPKDSKEYVHRVGRTARAGEEGQVINLLSEYDYDNFSRIKSEYREFNIKKLEKPYVERINAVQPEESERRDGRGRNQGGYGDRERRGPPRRGGGGRPGPYQRTGSPHHRGGRRNFSGNR